MKDLLVYAIAKELGTSEGFKNHVKNLIKEHNEYVKEYGRPTSDAPKFKGYIRINKETLMNLITSYCETGTPTFYTLRILKRRMENVELNEEDLYQIGNLLDRILCHNGVAVEFVPSNNDNRLYYNEEFTV